VPTASLPLPWLDRSGRVSPLKAATFALCLMPGIVVAVGWSLNALGPKPVTAAIHETGEWAVRFLLLSLAVTPFRFIADAPKLILVRRMLGLTVLAYAVAHLLLYSLDLAFDLKRIATEIVLRIYLTIGFVALIGLAVLGATSTDAAVRRLGGAWHTLHRLVYGIAVLALIHFFLQSKLDVSEAAITAGLFLLLMIYRAQRRAGFALKPLPLLVAALLGGALTALLEAGWYTARNGASVLAVLGANLEGPFEAVADLRPAQWVLLAGLAVVAVKLARPRRGRDEAGRAARVARGDKLARVG
jgi:sulfoxide reductase heme-binding subunit YedZ